MTSFIPGGTERQMTELVRRLDAGRGTVHVACFHARGAWFGRIAERAASITEFPIEGFRRLDTFTELRRFAAWCRQNQLAIVHTADLYANIFGLPGAALAGVPVRIGNRREINPNKTVGQIATQRAAYAVAHKVVANSRAAADRLLAERVSARKIVVVPNGLDIGLFSPRAPRARLRTVIVVANLRAEKGHDVLIDAAPEVTRQFPDVRFEFVGAGPELERLRARARAAGVGDAIAFLGHREDVGARLDAADIFVLPSRSDAFPNAVLEAMAAGLPVVASSVGGICELVDDGRNGLLVPPDDASALADRICRLMSDAPWAASLGEAARRDAEATYSFDRMVDGFERTYLSELARRKVIPSNETRVRDMTDVTVT